MKNVLLYMALFVLIILLLLPVGLRLFAKDLYGEKPSSKKDDVMISMKCIKSNETIKMTYLNDKPYSFWYQIVGEVNITPGNEDKAWKIISDIEPFAKKDYSLISGATEYKIDLFNYNADNTPDELLDYTKKMSDQSIFYSSYGFICTTSNI